MQFIKIDENYAVNIDRIVDVAYAHAVYADGMPEDGARSTEARVVIRIAGTAEVEERTLEGEAAEDFWSRVTGVSLR
jgi:hypothetical protein